MALPRGSAGRPSRGIPLKPAWFAFEVTPRCNLSCGFCYNVWLRPGASLPREMSIPEIRSVLGGLASHVPGAGVTLTGGEPLLREDLPGIAGIARETGFAVAVATNGTMLTPALAGELFTSGVRHFDIGVETPVGMVSDGIAAASATGASVTLSFCVTSRTWDGTREVAALAGALGASAVCLNRFVPRGRSGDDGLLPSSGQLSLAFQAAGEAGSRFSLPVYAGVPVEPRILSRTGSRSVVATSCECGRGKWAVGPDGGLRVCEQSPVVIGNLLSEDFSALRRHPLVGLFRKPPEKPLSGESDYAIGCFEGCRFLR